MTNGRKLLIRKELKLLHSALRIMMIIRKLQINSRIRQENKYIIIKELNKENCYPIAELCILGDNSIVSYVLASSNNNQLVFSTLNKAIEQNPDARPLFHSDRGFQYTNKIFKNKLDKINATQSMSRISSWIDNGPMEGFWGTLKSEMYYLRKFDTYEELEQAIAEYIDFYNTKRLQKKLKSMTPIEYRSHTLVA
ncbi:IS3 family transposase [Clostridium botulinum]|uniref:IS3 family transposase n=1 Tax=Clostridium botulinum TaxID=1491 RepID=UPI0019689A0D|nr:IS3 family transposase [Clostridium botulinum]MBN1064488.1 hypothetical protein [Clostridium botulinum]